MNIGGFKKTLLALALTGFSVMSHASLSITPTNTLDAFESENGWSIPPGTRGWVNATVSTTGGLLTFTYGHDLGLNTQSPPAGPASGFGDASFLNEFLLGGSTVNCFVNHPAATGNTCTNTLNTAFTVNVAAGNLDLMFKYNGPSFSTLENNGALTNTGTGAYLAAGSLSSRFAGPTNVVYLGLSDQNYGLTSGDHDFQDLALSITAVPEPESYAMMLAGLGLMGFVMRRRNQKAA